jgi:hypothetical protein
MKSLAADERLKKLKLRDDLLAELKTREETIRDLRQQLAVKEAYMLGFYEGNLEAAPTPEYLDSIIS